MFVLATIHLHFCMPPIYKNRQPIQLQLENQAPPCSSEDKGSIFYVTNKLPMESLDLGIIIAIIR